MKKKKRKQAGTSTKARQERHARFVDAYLANGENATQAYLAVNPGVANTTAATEGYKLLRIPDIHRVVEERRAALRARFALTSERVIQELGRIAYFDPRGVLDASGNARALHQIDDDTAAGLTLELDGDGKVLKMRTPPTGAKNTAVRLAAKILRLEDKPPPPPPDPETGSQAATDPRDTARRMAFLLARGQAATEKAEPRQVAKAVKKKAPLAA